MITVAVLGLASSGWVGKAVDYVFILLAGNWSWLLEWYLIFYAVYLMIKRERLRMTARWWGFVVILLVVLTWSHMNLYQSITRGLGADVPEPSMFSMTIDHINAQADYNDKIPVGSNGQPAAMPSAGGGLTGFVFFQTTHYLFDTVGTMFVLLMGGLASVLLITKKSLVVVLGSGRDRLANRLSRLFGGIREWFSLLHEKREKLKQQKRKSESPAKRKSSDDDLVEHEELAAVAETPSKPKKEKVTFLRRQESADGEPEFVEAGEEAEQDQLSFTIQSFADQLMREQQEEQEALQATGQATPPATQREIDLPKFVMAEDSPQIKVQFDRPEPSVPLQQAPVKEGPRPPKQPELPPLKGVAGEEVPAAADASLPMSMTAMVEDAHYELPPMSLLDLPKNGAVATGREAVMRNARKLEQTFESFGVHVKVVNVQIGPTVTQFEVQPAVGVKVSRIVSLSDDIALALAAKDIRMEAPIPGKSAIGIEVPNADVAIVTLREVLESTEFQTGDAKLSVVLGRDISGRPIVGNLAKMPHVLVAGATGSGKSVCVNGIITSILYKAKPSEVKFIMVDPKMVELNVYNGIPHLMAPVVTDPRRAAYALKKVVAEMEQRYELFSKTGVRNMDGYNALMEEKGQPKLPYIVVIVDELADLMMVAPGDVEDAICRLAQMARAAGIHMIIATQRPSVDVITGVIKANIPSRIAFAVSSQVDSRTILDSSGAEKLLGRGDMLYLPVGASKPTRVQGAFLSDGEVERVVSFCKEQGEAQYSVDLTNLPSDDGGGKGNEELDDLFYDAVALVIDSQQASVSMLQRKLKVGYARAARIVDQMEDNGYVGPFEGSKPRDVLVTREQWVMMQQAASE
ncbi:MAG TPA: DNA translocase FtsK [Bacilli bacterium]|nr:DNA translocase FtsK [Bacilli bacterium]